MTIIVYLVGFFLFLAPAFTSWCLALRRRRARAAHLSRNNSWGATCKARINWNNLKEDLTD